MADEPEKSGLEPNLELPSLLGFGRKKKRKGDIGQDEPATEELVAPEAAAQPGTEELPAGSDPLAADPVAEPRGGLAPTAEKPRRLPPVPPPTRLGPQATRVPPPPPPPVVPADEVEETVVEVAPEAAPGPAPEAAPGAAPEAPTEQTIAMPAAPAATSEPPVQFVAPAYGEHPVSIGNSTGDTTGDPAGQPARGEGQVEVAEAPLDEPAPARRTTSLRMPVINPRIAAFVTGAFVGLVGVLLAYFASRGCEAIRGVGSCGGIGLFALLVILAIQVVIGAAALRAWRVFDPVSTSFLGVGLVAVFVLLFLLSSLESVWMLLVIPVLTGLTFLLSWWVTTAFVEDTGSS